MNNQNFFEAVKLNLTDKDIIEFFHDLGVDNYEIKNDAIIFPTICHNADVHQASMKLYYYKNNNLFHCYTDCGESFDIFGLINRYCNTNSLSELKKKELYRAIITKVKYTKGIEFDRLSYTPMADKYKKPKEFSLLPIPSSTLLAFTKYYTEEWLNEGITPEIMDKYNILFSISQNKIIIPHFDVEGHLVGIRGRALNPEDIEKGKYRPVTIEEKTYSHPLSQNLYGLNLNKNNIKVKQFAVVFEGEKSVLLMDKYYPTNCSVASCGSNFHKAQLKLLLNCGVSEIVIAYDKENTTSENSGKYFEKLWNMCSKYKNYCNFSFIFDRFGLLNDKDSPIDKGKEIFETLIEQRIKV